jgi:hypothetical protein
MRPDNISASHAAASRDHRLERLIDRLPRRVRASVHWLRRPGAAAVRIPAGVLLTCGGVFGFLPVLGFWMFPLGLALLADDVPPLTAARARVLDWIERRYPHWFASR